MYRRNLRQIVLGFMLVVSVSGTCLSNSLKYPLKYSVIKQAVNSVRSKKLSCLDFSSISKFLVSVSNVTGNVAYSRVTRKGMMYLDIDTPLGVYTNETGSLTIITSSDGEIQSCKFIHPKFDAQMKIRDLIAKGNKEGSISFRYKTIKDGFILEPSFV